MSNPEPIPLAMLNAFVYCPRRFYYEFVEGLMLTNEHVEEGRTAHERVDEIKPHNKRVKCEALQTRSLSLSSERYAIMGKIDLVEEKEGKTLPIEYKKRKTPKDGDGLPFVYDNDRVQLCAQTLLLEDNGYSEIKQGYVYFIGSKQRVSVEFDEALRQKTLQTIQTAQRLAQEGPIPPPLEDDPRCVACSLLPLCLPEETHALTQGLESTQLKPLLPTRHDEGVLYVQTQGATVQKRGNSLIIKSSSGETLEEIPLVRLRQLVVQGYAQLSTQALSVLMNADIPIVYLSPFGRFKGICTGLPTKNGLLRVAQYELSRDYPRCLSLSRVFVKAKVHNQRVSLMRYARSDKESDSLSQPEAPSHFESAIKQLKDLEEGINKSDNIQSLLGIEGTSARLYFSLFPHILLRTKREGQLVIEVCGERSESEDCNQNDGEDTPLSFDFEGRNRRPPRDPVNALLSLAYSLLAKDCFSACLTVGLDPYIGFFHQGKYGRPALALDIMEEFRPIIADSVVISVINNRVIQEDDFLITKGACYLKEDARKRFFETYEARLNTIVTHPLFGYKLSYSRVIELQFRLLVRVINGEIPSYQGFEVR